MTHAPLFFRVSDGRTFQIKEGVDLADLGAARAEVTKRAEKLLVQEAAEFWNHQWSIDLMDTDGITLCTLHFLAVVGAPLRSDTEPVRAMGV